jgi:hypothetical protein
VSPTRFNGKLLEDELRYRDWLSGSSLYAEGRDVRSNRLPRINPDEDSRIYLLLNPAQTTDLADASVICERCRVCEGRNFELLWEARMPPNPVDTRL